MMPSLPGQSPAHSHQQPAPGVAVHSGGGGWSEWRSVCATLGELLNLSGHQLPSEPSA